MLKVAFTIAAFMPCFYLFKFNNLMKKSNSTIYFESFMSTPKAYIWVIYVPSILTVKKEPEGSLVHCFFFYYSSIIQIT
ncbi:hypothetical protein VCHA51O444_100038 [Vibrio chagasii]|nr:hypothetical protein VCHA51O444_100038 [Vibrio chagasii]